MIIFTLSNENVYHIISQKEIKMEKITSSWNNFHLSQFS